MGKRDTPRLAMPRGRQLRLRSVTPEGVHRTAETAERGGERTMRVSDGGNAGSGHTLKSRFSCWRPLPSLLQWFRAGVT